MASLQEPSQHGPRIPPLGHLKRKMESCMYFELARHADLALGFRGFVIGVSLKSRMCCWLCNQTTKQHHKCRDSLRHVFPRGKKKGEKAPSTPDSTGVFRPPSRLPRRPPPATDSSLFTPDMGPVRHGAARADGDGDKGPENEARVLRNQKRVDSRAALLVDGWSLLCDLGCAKGALKGWRGEAFGQRRLSALKYGVSFGGTFPSAR